MEENQSNELEKKSSSLQNSNNDKNVEDIAGKIGDVAAHDLIRIMKASLTTGSFSSPLPTPEILKGYKDLDPELLTLVKDMAQKEQNHRHEIVGRQVDLEDTKLRHQNEQITRGQRYGMIITSSCLLLAGIGLFLGFPLTGIGFIAIGALNVAASFIQRRIALKDLDQLSEQSSDKQKSPD